VVYIGRYIVGITGASGSIYAVRLVEELLRLGHEVHTVITHNGHKVMDYELEPGNAGLAGMSGGGLGGTPDRGPDGGSAVKPVGRLIIHDVDDLFAPIASGSFRIDGMAVVPCSMATLGELAAGISKNLLGRAADVSLKERRTLVLVPRETPLNTIHLKNMLSLSEAGAVILPAMPAFYGKPVHINDMVDFIVGRVLQSLGIDNDLFMKWGEKYEK